MSERSRAPDLGSAREIEEGLGDPFTAAFRATRMAMVITDPRKPDNPITFVNDAFTQLTGYSRDEVLGRNCRFLQGPDTDAESLGRIRDALRAGEGIELDILNYRKDGSPFWNSLVISPVRNEAGDLLYYFSSQADVSAKKNLEFELTRARDRLEEEVARRTRDLQIALDQQTALLHEVDHRVKNSLQVVSSLVLLKARRIEDEGVREVLLNLAERISALSTVHRMLYSAGDVSRFDLAQFISELSGDLVTTKPEGQLELRLHVDPVAVPAAKAAPLALLMNEILANAVKHAHPPQSPGCLSVELTRPGNDLRIVVEDDGIGMDSGAAPEHGFGKTLIELLGRQLRANVDWEDARPGTRVVVTMPLNAEEAHL